MMILEIIALLAILFALFYIPWILAGCIIGSFWSYAAERRHLRVRQVDAIERIADSMEMFHDQIEEMKG